jgi:lipopolysaccharide export system protein LptA
MRLVFSITIIILFSFNIIAREIGETEITTEDGIEVFQDEKYYLLKKNVKILSDNFNLNAKNVKINFDKSLYDITELNAKGEVNFVSPKFGLNSKSETLKFEVISEKLRVDGKNSELITKDIEMYSDGFIEVNNLNGDFKLEGLNSKLINESIFIKAEKIEGVFSNIGEESEITYLNVIDKKVSYVKNNNTEMYAKKINFDNKTSIIELIDNVIINRNGEKIMGDYGTLNTKSNSYKIESNNDTKVKVVIQNNE